MFLKIFLYLVEAGTIIWIILPTVFHEGNIWTVFFLYFKREVFKLRAKGWVSEYSIRHHTSMIRCTILICLVKQLSS